MPTDLDVLTYWSKMEKMGWRRAPRDGSPPHRGNLPWCHPEVAGGEPVSFSMSSFRGALAAYSVLLHEARARAAGSFFMTRSSKAWPNWIRNLVDQVLGPRDTERSRRSA